MPDDFHRVASIPIQFKQSSRKQTRFALTVPPETLKPQTYEAKQALRSVSFSGR